MNSNMSVFVVILTFFLFAGCCKEETTNNAVTGKLIGQSDCKQFLKSTSSQDDESCVEYSYNASSKTLAIKHINAGFNCCPDGVYCQINLSGNTITIEEFENAALCNCECLFDLDIKVEGLESGIYHIRFIEPYCGEQEKLDFTVDLNQIPDGKHCVERDLYPWGTYK